MTYTPSGYAIIRSVVPEEPSGYLYKIIGSWDGSFTEGAAWRINSGITSIERDGEMLNIHGYSGSIYHVPVVEIRLNTYTLGILRESLDNSPNSKIITTEEVMGVFKCK